MEQIRIQEAGSQRKRDQNAYQMMTDQHPQPTFEMIAPSVADTSQLDFDRSSPDFAKNEPLKHWDIVLEGKVKG